MSPPRPEPLYPLSATWQLILRDLGIPAAHVLRRAQVREDLFASEHAATTADEFARMIAAVDAEADDPALAIRIGEALSFEMFDPPVFAAMCSEDLDTALDRVGRYKRLCAPIRFAIARDAGATRVAFSWDAPGSPPPLVWPLELAFCVRLARLGTRTQVVPRAVECPHPLAPAAAYRGFFGVAPVVAPGAAITFAAADARAPFLTAKAGMWGFFEPELRRRLAELDAGATLADRVRAALLELLPGGRASVHEVAMRLAVSARTLQRRLRDEATSFQAVLDRTREELARHYLATSGLTGAEVSYLLGFQDPNSFARAFQAWTGTTPEQARKTMARSVGGMARLASETARGDG